MKRSDRESYYSAHRSEVLARAKRRREANIELYRERSRESVRRWRECHVELNSKRQVKYNKKWRESHRDKYRTHERAKHNISLGSCCKFCGSKDDLMRFLPDYDYSDVVVTVCRECRAWVRHKHK